MTPYYQDDLMTIYHGDCREWMPEADVIVTDPPYGMGYIAWGNRHRLVAGDRSTEARDVVLDAWTGPALVFGTWKAPRPSRTAEVLIWDKGGSPGLGNVPRGPGRSGARVGSPWGSSHEEIYVLGDGFAGVPRMGSVLRFDRERGPHPTHKPIALMAHLASRCPEGVILDPFMGAGSTLLGARHVGRKAIGIEIEERYCEIAARRCSQDVLGLVASTSASTSRNDGADREDRTLDLLFTKSRDG